MLTRTVALLLAALALCASLSGCKTREEYYCEVAGNRTASFDRWLAAEEVREEDRPIISGELSLADALKLGLLYNKSLSATFEERGVAEGTVVESLSAALPKVDGSFDYVRFDENVRVEVDGEEVGLGALDNYSFALSVSQPVYRGGAIGAAIRAAEIFQYQTDERIRDAVQRALFDVTEAYYAALLAKELYNVQKDAVESAAAQLKDVTLKRAQGVASDFDVLRAEVDLTNFEALMIQRQNAHNIAMTALFRRMGVSQQSEVEMTTELEYKEMKPDLAESVKTALENRPDLYRAELDVKIQQELVDIAKSSGRSRSPLRGCGTNGEAHGRPASRQTGRSSTASPARGRSYRKKHGCVSARWTWLLPKNRPFRKFRRSCCPCRTRTSSYSLRS
jgi:outer membrane protein TolC